MANPFQVAVPSVLQSLMAYDESYGGAQKDMQRRKIDAARQDAQQAIAGNGDTRGALARLLGAGDYQGAAVLNGLGKSETTDEIREYNLAKSQGFRGSFFDFKSGLKRAGATSVNVNTGEKEYDKALGKASADRFLEYQKAGQSAIGEQATLDTLEKLTNDPNFYSGVGAERFALPMKQIISRMGGDPNAAASMETFRALSNKSVLDSMGGSLGTGFSNADRDFVVGQVANLGNTPEGNKQIIGITKKVAKRKQEIAKIARDYAARNGGRIDAGLDQEIAAYAEKNPLFPQAQNDGGWNDLGNGVRIREKR